LDSLALMMDSIGNTSYKQVNLLDVVPATTVLADLDGIDPSIDGATPLFAMLESTNSMFWQERYSQLLQAVYVYGRWRLYSPMF